MKKKVVKEAGRIAKKEIGEKIEGAFFGMLFLVEDGDDTALSYYDGYINGIAAAGAISNDLARELRSALAYAASIEWEPEPEPEISYVVVYKHCGDKDEEVFNWERDRYAAWRMARDYDKKFDLEYIYVEEVENCHLASGWHF